MIWLVVGMAYICSCSFGKDSLAMLLKLIEENKPIDEVIFYDTGMEFNSIYHNRNRVKDILKKEGVKFTELSGKNHFLYDMFCRPIKYRDQTDREYPYHYGFGWCGKIRWATTWKTQTISSYLKKEYGSEEVFEYVGIAYDEQSRVKDNPHKVYPLIEWEMTEKDCLQYCYDKGFHWDENGVELYSVLDRVSCWCCQNKNLKELKNIYLYLPEYWQRLRGLQSRIPEAMKGEGKSVFDLERRFEAEERQLKFEI